MNLPLWQGMGSPRESLCYCHINNILSGFGAGGPLGSDFSRSLENGRICLFHSLGVLQNLYSL